MIAVIPRSDGFNHNLEVLYDSAAREATGLFDATGSGVEAVEVIQDPVLKAADHIPIGTTDTCGFAPFCDNMPTTRDTASATIRIRALGTARAVERLGAD